ncbi:MAG: DUF362 domain-containing protein [Candidatus Bathyarchaeia archaeon]
MEGSRTEAKVAVCKGQRSLGTVRRALEAVDAKNILSGRPVLIKVNFITTKRWDTGATTDPLVVEALIQHVKGIGGEVYVVESDATVTRADRAAEATGILNLCDSYNVEFINLSKIKDRITIEIPDHETLGEITIPRLVLESHIVSAAKMKTHTETTVTLGLKNMFGLLPDRFKGKYHVKGISKVIVDINSVLKPALTVIDGFVAMEGPGPVSGYPVKMDLVLAGRDPVATDATAARVMGFDPHKIQHIRRCFEKGLGEMDRIQILGDRIEEVKRNFKPP